MLVYRISKRQYAKDLSGRGALMFGGRWNKKGTPVLYTGESKEIALLELVVHTSPLLIPKLDIVTIEIQDKSIETFNRNDLPEGWYRYPPPTVLSEIGSKWAMDCKSIALKVPSSIIHSSNIFILNCLHPKYSTQVKIKEVSQFYFDPRLIK